MTVQINSLVDGGESFERKFGIVVGDRRIVGSMKLAWPRSMVRIAA